MPLEQNAILMDVTGGVLKKWVELKKILIEPFYTNSAGLIKIKPATMA
ncbi:hypothetical protein [Bacillus sp. LL01]|nr:hypothetical protein [Bacillus sp. LL01]